MNAQLEIKMIKQFSFFWIELWTNSGDIVLDQHSGIASTGYVAVPMGRKYIGIELKSSYFKQGVDNMMSLGMQADLFGSG